MAKSNWETDLNYQTLCVEQVCEKLHISTPSLRNFIYELARHSESDGQFFIKVKTFIGLKPESTKQDNADDKIPNKITVIMKEYNDGKDAQLPALLETRLRELRGDD